MKTKWTQGPWAIEPVTHLIEKRRKEGKPTSYTANIIPTPDAAFRGYVCHMQDAEHINGIAGPECEANARLIAAAPEMAELLERNQNVLMDALTSGHGVTPAIMADMREVFADARVLLAKVTHA